jgi:hypothetical protein
MQPGHGRPCCRSSGAREMTQKESISMYRKYASAENGHKRGIDRRMSGIIWWKTVNDTNICGKHWCGNWVKHTWDGHPAGTAIPHNMSSRGRGNIGVSHLLRGADLPRVEPVRLAASCPGQTKMNKCRMRNPRAPMVNAWGDSRHSPTGRGREGFSSNECEE